MRYIDVESLGDERYGVGGVLSDLSAELLASVDSYVGGLGVEFGGSFDSFSGGNGLSELELGYFYFLDMEERLLLYMYLREFRQLVIGSVFGVRQTTISYRVRKLRRKLRCLEERVKASVEVFSSVRVELGDILDGTELYVLFKVLVTASQTFGREVGLDQCAVREIWEGVKSLGDERYGVGDC